MTAAEKEKKILQLVGLATRAGRVVMGVPLICTALQKGVAGKTPLLILEAADTSANTQKRLSERSAFYGVPLLTLTADCATLAHAVGKKEALLAAVGVTEPQLAKAIREAFENFA